MFRKYPRLIVLCVALVALIGATPHVAPAQGSGPVELTLREADSGANISLQADQLLVLDLEENLSTGYTWEVSGIDSASLKQLESTFVPAPARADGKPWVGVPGRQVLRFAALKAGASTLTLGYRRSWEAVSPARTYSVRVTGAAPVTGAALAYIAPAPQFTAPPKDQAAPLASMVGANANAAPAPSATTELSATLNWCSTDNPLGRNVCTTIRDQQNCGSCWAFATAGVIEAAIKKADGVDRDTSEQYLVSCNVEGASCNGGWAMFGLAINQVPAGETNPGVRWENDYPYQNANAPCNPPYAAHEVFVSSGRVTTSGSSTITDVVAIKQAITDYGPVMANICVGPAFQAYKGGILATDETAACNGSVNHAIVLYGWDDTDQVWYLRNSWGDDWGEGGTMRIKWGMSNVGRSTNYAVYNGPTAKFNIAGYVRTPGGLGVANATVSFNNTRSVKTNSAGYYIQTGFDNGSYTVKATATNYTMSPTQQTAVVSNTSVADINFTGTQPAQYHRISGYVQQPNGAAIPGATVSFTGTATRPSVKTDTFGFFSQDSVLSGTYTVTAVAAGYTISPTYRVAAVTTADVLVDPFIGSRITYTLTGYIKTGAGVGIPGVTVGFDGSFPAVTTNASGFWSRDGVYSGHPNVIPVKEGWTFNPTMKILTVKADQANINFTGSLATYNLTGTVVTTDGVPINGVTVSFGGVQPAMTTSGDGYMRTGFVSGTVVVVSPTLSGYSFTPPSRTITFGAADANASFIGTPLPVLHDIYGWIQKANGAPVANVSVSFGAARPPVTTDSDGFFVQTGFPDGFYTLEPTLSGYSFDPATQTLTLNGSDGFADFAATQLTFTLAGRVTVNGAGVPATLSFGNGLTTTANASGYYTMTDLPNGEYVVGPSYPGSRFTPAEYTVVLNDSDALDVDFDGTLLTYCISGYTRWIYANTPIAGVSVSISGTQVLTTTSDANGLFQRCDVPYGNQRIRFQSPNKYFSSGTRDLVVLGDLSNADAVGWTGYFTVTGRVVDALGNGFPNVTINYPEMGYKYTTDATGVFTLSKVFADLTLVPKRTGYTFSPSSIAVSANGTNQSGFVFTATQVVANAPTAATYALVGHVRDTAGNPVVGAMIYYEDGPDNIYLSTSGPEGQFDVQGIPAGTTYSFIGAMHPGYDFPSGYALSNITSDVTDLDFDGTQVADFMVGRAQLQGHYDAPSDQWWFGYPLTVEVFEPGGTTPIATHEVKIDSWGYFVVPGVTPGIYDVRIKNHHSLSQKILNVTIDAHQLVRFEVLHEGDVSDDDGIWYEDFNAMQNAFATCVGDPHYNPLADIDDNGCVWGYDISLLTTNFGIGGQTATTAAAPRTTPMLDSSTLRARLGVYTDAAHQANVPASVHGRFLLSSAATQDLAVGDIFTVTVGVRSPDRGLDSVTAFLNFDPNYLEVVDADGAPTDRVVAASTLPLVVVNRVYNDLGYIDLVVNRSLGSVPVTGTFDLATLRFRLKQATSGTDITFDNTDSLLALSDIDLEGYGYLKRDEFTPLPTVTVSSANHAPTVADDQYATTKNTVLRVSAPGATANDTDVDGDAFWLEWYVPPSHGDLTLFDDGSFVYTPTLNFVGTDSFDYQGSDGVGLSSWATVTIQVVDPKTYVYLPLVLR